MMNRQHITDGYLKDNPNRILHKYMIIDDRVHEIHNVVVHRFSMGDVDDPILYAAQPLYEWEKSEEGQWIMEHAVESPMWHRMNDNLAWGHEFTVTAKLKAKDYSYFLLKWGKEGTAK
jgi:hypothetical protein